MLSSLALPIMLSAVALFFASFLSWMVLQLHKKDWKKVPREDEFLAAVRSFDVPPGSYMFPHMSDHKEMKNEEFRKKFETGPRGSMTIFPIGKMSGMLGLTFVYFLAVSFGLAYLSTIALKPGADFLAVFRFVATAGFMVFLAAIVSHAIWFRIRIVGHIIESVAYAAIVGAIFAAMWPA